jgi:riboflavin synthase alpha subunit
MPDLRQLILPHTAKETICKIQRFPNVESDVIIAYWERLLMYQPANQQQLKKLLDFDAMLFGDTPGRILVI